MRITTLSVTLLLAPFLAAAATPEPPVTLQTRFVDFGLHALSTVLQHNSTQAATMKARLTGGTEDRTRGMDNPNVAEITDDSYESVLSSLADPEVVWVIIV